MNDEKFIDGFISKHEEVNSEIDNYYFAWKDTSDFRHISNSKVRRISSGFTYKDLIEIIGYDPKVILFHSLLGRNKEFVKSLPLDIKLGWIFYGGEVFNRNENINLYLGKKTKNFVHWQLRRFPKIFLRSFEFLIKEHLYEVSPAKVEFHGKLLNRFSFFAHWIKDDFGMVQNKYSLKDCSFIPFCYSNSTPLLPRLEKEKKQHLLIGNSGSYTNNHLDIIEMLPKTFYERFDKIIFPISYGGSKKYLTKVKNAACRKFGQRVFFLETFMPKSHYFELLSGVRLAIMPHYRSEGGGNIRFFLKNKIDIAMFGQNEIFRFYERNGVVMHDISECLEEKFDFLSDKYLDNNKMVVERLFEGNGSMVYYRNLRVLLK